MRRLKNSIIEKIRAMETGAEVGEMVNKSLAEKVEELEKQIDMYTIRRIDPCPTCGCNELLCGFPSGCTSEANNG